MIDSSLLRQIALVTGGSSGIGAAIARHLAQAWAAVAINYNSNPDPAEKLAKDIQTDGGEAIALQANLMDGLEETISLRRFGLHPMIQIMFTVLLYLWMGE